MRILIVGHACAPSSGSELAVTWNWAWHLAELHQVVVITHPQLRGKVEAQLARQPRPNLSFEWVELPERWDPWTPHKSERGIKLHYLMWQRKAFRRSRTLHAQRPFEIAHHVSWGTVGISTPLWRLGIPMIWGPLGGAQIFPLRFLAYAGRRWPLELLRYLRLGILPYLPTFRRTVRRASAVLATNGETASLLERVAGYQPPLFLDCGINEPELATEPPIRPLNGPLQVLWIGRAEARKGLLLAIDAVAAAKVDFRLTVAGSGPEIKRARRRVVQAGLTDKVRFLGQIPREEVLRLMSESHCFLFTSLRDSFGSVVMEALGSGLPVVALDHQGVAACLPREAVLRVAVDHPRQCIADLAEALHSLVQSPDLRRRLSEAGLAAAREQLWPNRARAMDEIYRSALTRFLAESRRRGEAAFEGSPGVPAGKLVEGSRD